VGADLLGHLVTRRHPFSVVFVLFGTNRTEGAVMRIAITGANAGIGLRATERLARAGHEVVALCRDLGRGHAALAHLDAADRARVDLIQLDLSSSASIRAAAAVVVEGGALDALVNNAAIFDLTMREPRITEDGHELFWATNHLGPTEFTARVSPALARAATPRVVFVASKGIITMPRIRIRYEALDGAGWYTPTRAYYHSKLAQIMTATTLAELAGDRVDVSCLRVPAVKLDPDRLAAQPPLLRALYAPKDRVAAAPEALAEVYEALVTGGAGRGRGAPVYVDEQLRGVAVPRFARDRDQRARLWALTDHLTGTPDWAWRSTVRHDDWSGDD
jgi:NAD(P)-dependent dehydrogenase (short-subunit alcohol dehydrogenase family)